MEIRKQEIMKSMDGWRPIIERLKNLDARVKSAKKLMLYPQQHRRTPGGAQTNKNGLKTERELVLSAHWDVVREYQICNAKVREVRFHGSDIIYLYVPKHGFTCWLKENNLDYEKGLPGTKQPDHVLIDTQTNKVIVIEVKTQAGSGSVIEKYQPTDKMINLMKICKREVRYAYWFGGDWFTSDDGKKECNSTFEYLDETNTPRFFGIADAPKIVDFILSTATTKVMSPALLWCETMGLLN